MVSVVDEETEPSKAKQFDQGHEVSSWQSLD